MLASTGGAKQPEPAPVVSSVRRFFDEWLEAEQAADIDRLLAKVDDALSAGTDGRQNRC